MWPETAQLNLVSCYGGQSRSCFIPYHRQILKRRDLTEKIRPQRHLTQRCRSCRHRCRRRHPLPGRLMSELQQVLHRAENLVKWKCPSLSLSIYVPAMNMGLVSHSIHQFSEPLAPPSQQQPPSQGRRAFKLQSGTPNTPTPGAPYFFRAFSCPERE